MSSRMDCTASAAPDISANRGAPEATLAFRPPAPEPPDVVPALKLLWAVFFNPLHVWRRQHFAELLVVEPTPLGTRLVISDPALIKWILVDNARNYVRDSLQQRVLHRLTGRSLFSAEGGNWQLQRRIMAPHFAAKALPAHIPGIAAAALDAVAHLAGRGGGDFDLSREMWALTVDVLGRTIFPDGLDETPAQIADNLRQFSNANSPVELGDLLGLPPGLPGIRRLLGWRARQQVRRRARGVLAAARASGRSADNDFLSALIAAGQAESGDAVDERMIMDNISAMLGAGSDTAAVTLTWAIFLLSQAPQVREAVEAEVDTHLRDGVATAGTLASLVWTRAVIEEAMRLYPPAPLIGRMSLAADRLGERLHPAGTTILIAPWLIHRHRQLWEDPDRFRPERFLPGQREQIPRFAYLPFGAGPHACLGMGLAMQETIVILAMLVRHFRFERADDRPIRLRHCMTLQTAEPLRMRARARP